MSEQFSEVERQALYRVMKLRRDIRHFSSKPVPDEVLERILEAAHTAPSVGFMQPWNFILVTSVQLRQNIRILFEQTNQAELAKLTDYRKSQLYRRLKLEGILEAPLNIAVTCDRQRDAPFVLGRGSMPEMDLFSTCLAIQNMWLAARAEGIGLGWVSLFDRPALEKLLELPAKVRLVAYLCVGYPLKFRPKPMLEELGWKARLNLPKLVYKDTWGQPSQLFVNETQLEPKLTQSPASQNLTRLNPASPLTPVEPPSWVATSPEIGGQPDEQKLAQVLAAIGPLDLKAIQSARLRQARLTKPAGSLGRLEELSYQLAGITGQDRPKMFRKSIVVMAADHGVSAEGVSAYLPEVTSQMVVNFLMGGAAINVFARQLGIRLVVADLGVASDLLPHAELLDYKIGYGTQNMAKGPAMSRQEALRAVWAGLEIARQEIERGVDLLGTGDMGIGNTTASSAILACFSGLPVDQITGRGTGLDDEGWQRKVGVIQQSLAVNRPNPLDPLDVLSKVGGFEIAGLVGFIFGAAATRVPVVIDGFISTAAALVACRWQPAVHHYLIAAHNSVEVGHRIMLELMELNPLVNLNLRLGEGTGAALIMPLVEGAARALDEMATFDEAGVNEENKSSLFKGF